MAATKKTITDPKQLVIQQLNVVSSNFSRKDIASAKSARGSARLAIHPNRVKLYDLYEDILDFDGHLGGIVNKRISATLRKLKKLTFNDSTGAPVEDIVKLIRNNPRFRELVRKLLEAKSHGLTGVNFKIGNKFDWVEIPRKHIKPHLGIISIDQYGDTGIPYQDDTFIWVICPDDKELGYLLACSVYALWKRGGMGDWAQYVEIFGQPAMVYEYDAYDDKMRIEVERVMDATGSALRIMVPKGVKYSTVDGKTSNGDGKLQDTHRKAMNEEMSIKVLGVTETTSSSTSSGHAQSQVHADEQENILDDDLTFALQLLNSEDFINVLESYGYKALGGAFEYAEETDLDKLGKKLKIDTVVSGKVPVEDDYFYKTYNIPKPANYNQLKKEKDAAAKATRDALQNAAKRGKTGSKKNADDKNLSLKDEQTIVRKIQEACDNFIKVLLNSFR